MNSSLLKEFIKFKENAANFAACRYSRLNLAPLDLKNNGP